jgi:Leucine-rich repeat (LRR) protein
MKEIENLKYINLSNCNINDFTSIKGLKNIQEINISNNPIQDINFLNEFECKNSLITFICSDNKIIDISSLSEFYYLKEIYLNNNNIFDLSPLFNIFSLFFLDLRFNSINNLILNDDDHVDDNIFVSTKLKLKNDNIIINNIFNNNISQLKVNGVFIKLD